MIFAKNKLTKLISLADMTADQITPEDLTAANEELKAARIESVMLVSAEAYKQLQADMQEAQKDATAWKEKAEVYGSQPGTFPTSAVKKGTDAIESVTDTIVYGEHFGASANLVAQFQLKK